jgi:S-adenosylmethionine hydrolase
MRPFLLSCCIICLTSSFALAQVEEQTTGETKGNAEGGYDFYNVKTKQKTGSSRKVREDIFYYDRHGNLVGKAKKDRRNSRAYNYYNADGVRVGILKKKTDGSYSYMDNQSGKMIQARPLKRGDVGSLPPQTIKNKEE